MQSNTDTTVDFSGNNIKRSFREENYFEELWTTMADVTDVRYV